MSRRIREARRNPPRRKDPALRIIDDMATRCGVQFDSWQRALAVRVLTGRQR